MSENVISTATKMNEIRFIFVKHMNNLASKNMMLNTEKNKRFGVFDPIMPKRYEVFLESIIEKMKNQSLDIIESYMIEFVENENINLRYSNSPQQRTKRFSKDTLEILEDSFHINEYPTDEEKARLAKRCRITSKQVSNWFTNKRNRAKNNQRRLF